MPRSFASVRCVLHGSSAGHRSPFADAMVIMVIGVLACVLSVYGLELSSVLAVLGGAGLVAAGTLTAVRGAGKRLHRSAVQAVTALAAG